MKIKFGTFKNKIMKIQSNNTGNLLDTLTRAEIKSLTKEVKETIGTTLGDERKRNFTSAELWNIHRNKKNISHKKIYF